MRVVSYVAFQVENLFFVGEITETTATQIVIEDEATGRKAIYGGAFTYPGGVPAGTIEELTLYSGDAVQVEFTEAAWDATAYFAYLAAAVASGDTGPLVGLVTAENDVAIGSEFGDNFLGGRGRDIVLGRAGNDYLNGGAGHDLAFGGRGDDQIVGRLGNDDLRGGWGDDILVGRRHDDTLTGGLGRDSLYGGFGRDVLIVDDDDYVIKGGPGRDTLSLENYEEGVTLTGSYGFLPYWEMRVWGTSQQISDVEIVIGSDYGDCLYVNGFAQRVRAGAGNDGVQGGAIDEVFFGGLGEDVLAGGDGADRLFGRAHNDTLLGQNGWDDLLGGRGADLLVGGRGGDMLKGGPGADVFAFSRGHGTANEILDFKDGRDRIQFWEVAFDFEDLTVTDDIDGARVSAGNVSVLVHDTDAAALTEEDFLFGRVPDYAFFPECG